MTASPLGLFQASGNRAQRRGFDYAMLTPAQRAFVECTEREALWRDGNQLGKSFALAWFCIALCLGTHPTINRRVPIEVMVISVSREQMVPLMEKLWDLVPRDLIAYGEWDPGRGLVGKPPRLVFTNGSKIVFATYKQGASRVAGGTYDVVVMDEPPPETMYGEIRPRVFRRRGLIRVTMTPTPDMPDQSWYRDRVRAGSVTEFNWGLSEAMLQPEGYPAPWLRQDEIDEYAQGLLEAERKMRIDGAWEAMVTGRWLADFDEGKHVRRLNLKHYAGWHLGIGCDHGTIAGKQTAMLTAVKDRASARPQVVFLDETVSEGVTTPEHDADAILMMLERNGIPYDAVDEMVGDVPTGSKRWDIRKSNRELRKEIARQLKRPLHKTKPIFAPKKHAASMSLGMRLLNTLFQRDHAMVDSRCVEFIKAANTFQGDTRDPGKDVLDGGRYSVERACTGRVMATLNARY